MDQQRLFSLTKELKEKVTEAISEKIKIVFVDEAIFSPQTNLDRTWSLERENVRVIDFRNKVKTHALVAGISEDRGLECYLIYPRSINKDSFIEFLQLLRSYNGDQHLIIFMDNLSVHKTFDVRNEMALMNMTPIYNVPYSPQYNGIESYFFLLKQQYKKMLLQQLLRGDFKEIVSIIKQALALVDDQMTINCIKGGIKEIMKINNLV